MAGSFTLRCLGRPELVDSGGVRVQLRTRKHLALLIYLAIEPKVAQRRDRLVDLLWSAAAPPEGRHSLSTALSMLRGKLGRAAIEGGRDHVRLAAPHLALDLDRLDHGEVLETQFVPALDVGGFLEDFEIPDAPPFQLWRDQQRARWLPTIQSALLVLIDCCRRTGDFGKIERYADRLLVLDDLSEDGIRGKMEARAFAGDRVAALKLFERWRKRLKEELNAEPSRLIEGMAIRLRRRGWERANTKEIAPVPTDQYRNRPFVGRTKEFCTLYEVWERTVEQAPSHILVLGDSGVGKSTLVERLATAAGLAGGASSRVQCYDLEHEIPYSNLSHLVYGLLALPGATATDPEALAELSRTAPRVRERFQSIPEAIESQGEISRIRLTEAVERLASSVAEEQPTMLVIDDFHLADDASIAVLSLLMRRIERHPVMVVLTARAGELGRSPNASRLRDVQARLNLRTLDLPPLSNDESAMLVHSLIDPGDPEPRGAVLKAILAAGAGFPMALELLVTDWKLNGERCLALSFEAMTEEPVVGSAPTSAYEKVLDRLTRDLDAVTRNVLNLAAVLGPRMNDLEMYALMDLGLGRTMTAMAELTELRILREGSRGLEFVNEVIRAQAYLAIPSPMRRALHGRITDRLLETDAEVADSAGLEIAWHSIRAGRVNEATPFLFRGARAAMRRGAPYEAERALATAADHLEEPDRSEAVVLQAEALTERGALSDAVRLLNRHSICTPDLQDLALVLKHIATNRLAPDVLQERQQAQRDLIELVNRSKSTEVRAQAIAAACMQLPECPTPELDQVLLEGTSSALFRDLPKEERGGLAYARARLLYRSGNASAALHTLREAKRVLQPHSVRSSSLGRLLLAEGALLASMGRYRESVNASLEAWAHATTLDNYYQQQAVAANLAVGYCRLGKFHKHIEWSRKGVSLSSAHQSPLHLVRHSAFLAMGYLLTGNSRKAQEVLERSVPVRFCTDPLVAKAEAIYTADVLRLAGLNLEALEAAKRGGVGGGQKFELTNLVGIYARWTAICGVTEDPIGALNVLRSLEKQRSRYDRLDQVEIFNARLWLEYKLGRGRKADCVRLIRELASLPVGVRVLLDRLGMLNIPEIHGPGQPTLITYCPAQTV